jgi:formate-nitrite transporter family protein
VASGFSRKDATHRAPGTRLGHTAAMTTRADRHHDKDAEERQSPHGKVVYKAIYSEGMDELSRDSAALAWSGFAAGLSMGFSLLTEALLRAHLPDTAWRPLVAKLGYAVGFLIVILGRQQLFTENTLTVILPLLRVKRGGVLANVMRLWLVVFVANVAGALLFSAAITFLPVLDPAVREAAKAIGTEALSHGFLGVLARGIFAGWLIALMVWLLPFAETGRVGVILIITYLVGLGGFSHVIAGSVEVYALSWMGAASWGATFGGFTIPSLIGNMLGGIALVAALAHVQFIEGAEALDL